MQLSCIFWYQKRVFKGKGEVLRDSKGEPVVNDNYISFLQVISAYWETLDTSTGKKQLNIFLNGGSVSRDRDTGEVQMKAGYTLQLPEFLGNRFMLEFYDWSAAFGLSTSPERPTERVPRAARPEGETRRGRSVVREDEFVDMENDAAPAAVFEEAAL